MEEARTRQPEREREGEREGGRTSRELHKKDLHACLRVGQQIVVKGCLSLGRHADIEEERWLSVSRGSLFGLCTPRTPESCDVTLCYGNRKVALVPHRVIRCHHCRYIQTHPKQSGHKCSTGLRTGKLDSTCHGVAGLQGDAHCHPDLVQSTCDVIMFSHLTTNISMKRTYEHV